MRALIEMVSLLQSSKLTTGELRPLLYETGSKSEILYELVAQKKVQTDDEAILAVYGDTKEVSSKYSSLKSRLKSRLVQAVFTIDFGETEIADREQAYLECNKRWAAANIFLAKHKRRAAVEVMEQLLRQTRHFEFTDLTINALYQLRLFYSSVSGDPRKYAEYRLLYRHYQTILNAENEAEDLYNDLMSQHAGNAGARKKNAVQAERAYQQIAHYLPEDDSFRLHLAARLLQINIYSNQGDHTTVERLCGEAIAFFKQKPYACKLPLQVFYYQLIICCIQLGKFEEGKAIIAEHQQAFEEGSYNWFKLQESHFLLAMHTRHYAEAMTIQQNMLKHSKLSAQPSWVQQTWKLYEAYIQFLVHIGKLQDTTTKFKLSKFLNDVPEFDQDKRFMNVPVLIVQTLFMLTGTHREQAVDRVEALEKYAGRYLREDDLLRSRCFMRMLCEIPKSGFKKVMIERKTENFLSKLTATPLEIANQSHEIEIIPYHDLWQLLMERI